MNVKLLARFSGLTTVILVTCLATAGEARAQSAPTCSYDSATATVTVSVNGNPARLRVAAATGEILLNLAPCGGATVVNTDTILVSGGALRDTVTLTGKFEPGLTPEADGHSEIELSFALSGGGDVMAFYPGAGVDHITFTSDGIDVGGDGDRDMATAGLASIKVDGGGGGDRIDASAYASPAAPPNATVIELHGGAGNDRLTGSTIFMNWMWGDDGDDVLTGGDVGDQLHGGMGNDRMVAGAGDDTFYPESTADGADDMRGGDGADIIDYRQRLTGITVTIGDTEPDGEPGEGDLVRGDIESIRGSHGNDVLVGNDAANGLYGEVGDDQIYGGAGGDTIYGNGGNDILVGDDGDDFLSGDAGDDSVDGGRGADSLLGGTGADVLQGGPAADYLDGGDGVDDFFGDEGNDTLVNADSNAETVDCGAGLADDAQASPLDTFVGCEL